MQALRRTQPFSLPIRIVQFGQGNFMRGFFDWQIDLLNERTGLNAGVVMVRPRGGGDAPLIDAQDGLFTTLVRGIDEHGTPIKQYRQIRCVQREIDIATLYGDYLALARNPDLRFIASNTTEAGIATNATDRFDDAPPSTFPAKLARLLYERFVCFDGDVRKGVVLLPLELIDNNGPALKAAILHFAHLWQLGEPFVTWLHEACTFCSTLVDRIVTGYPATEIAAIEAELGYRDPFLVAAEDFYQFVIEGPAWLADELRLHGAGLNVKLVDDIVPYKQRKVGILNGGHTTLVPVALLAGLQTVREAVDDPQIGAYLRDALEQEIIPALPLDQGELEQFAADVLLRLRNPNIRHLLVSIALNSWSKFAARVMPQLLHHVENQGRPPRRLVLALAATLRLYRGDVVTLADDAATLAWFRTAWARVGRNEWTHDDLVRGWLANDRLWGRKLDDAAGLAGAVRFALDTITRHGIRKALAMT